MMECYDAKGIMFHHVNNDACMNGPLSKGQFFALFFFFAMNYSFFEISLMMVAWDGLL